MITDRHLGSDVGANVLERVLSGAEEHYASFDRVVVDGVPTVPEIRRGVVPVVVEVSHRCVGKGTSVLVPGDDAYQQFPVLCRFLRRSRSGHYRRTSFAFFDGWGSLLLPAAVQFLSGSVVEFLVFEDLLVGYLQFCFCAA